MGPTNLGSALPGIWRVMHTKSTEDRAPVSHDVRRAVAQYALSGVAVLILLGAAGVYLLRHIGQDEAIRNATQVAELAGRGVVEPLLTPALMRGDAGAIARLDRSVHRGVLKGHIVRVKVWRADGTIVYSDEHRLIGSRYPLGADELQTFAGGGTQAEISDLARPENRFERPFHKLLEVYLRVREPNGRPLMFEAYERYSSVAASGRKLWLAFAPAILGALALLWLVQLPLAWRGARLLRDNQAGREKLLRRAIESSELERRRIARDLHDGAVQDLAGVSYSLTAAAQTIDTSSTQQTAEALNEAASGTRRTIRELRSLLVDIYPPDLHRTGLEAALRDLVAPLAPRGITADLEWPAGLDLPPALETLFYRCAQEALRNVARHSNATQVKIRVELDGGLARLCVMDNGRGFDRDVEEGHLGLRLLADLAGEAGGRLELESTPTRGTSVCIEAPL
jgi:two-component system NarL family sensor kinase